MCHGCYVPPVLLPVLYVLQAFGSIGRGIGNMDETIRANNLKMIELIKRKKHDLDFSASNQVLDKSSVSIQEIKKQIDLMNDEEKEQLAKLLIQRCVARLEQENFELAKEDMIEALSLMQSEETNKSSFGSFCKNFYLAEYLLGICCNGMGEFKEAANHFQKSILHRESVESQLVDNQDYEKELIAMEEQFFSMQLEAKKPIEKVAASWSKNWNFYSDSVTNFTNKAKNFYNHNLQLGADKPVLKTKPNTCITLELLYIRAGVSYYTGTYYSDALPYFNRAIELGESYQSEYLESSYYNRGLCYYYLRELKSALQDFNKSISLMPLLKQRDAVYLMRAACYGRLGMIQEKKNDENKARLINPFGKSLPLFHFRLLNEDLLVHIMSFLQTGNILVMASLNKYSRNLVKTYLQNYDIDINFKSLVAKNKQSTGSIVKSLFLPKDPMPCDLDMLKHVLKHPLLVENAKNIRLFNSFVCNNFGTSLEKEVIPTLQNLKRLTIRDFSSVRNMITKYSPDIEYFALASDSTALDELCSLLLKLKNIKHLRLQIALFSNGSIFSKFPNLTLVEYFPITKELKQAHPLAKTWEEISKMNPNIVFKECTIVSDLLEFSSY